MTKGEYFRKSATRVAVYYCALFIATLIFTSLTSYYFISKYLYERLDRHVLERFTEIENTLNTKGIAAAIKMIEDHGPQIRGEETLYILSNARGNIYSNSNVVEIPLGMSTLSVSVDGAKPKPFRIRRKASSQFDLSVGVNYNDTDRLLQIEFATFASSALLILVISFGSAFYSSKFTQRRIAHLTTRMHQIAKGRLNTRLPVSTRDDDIDALARGMTDALDKLQVSVEAIKRMSANAAHDLRAPIARVRLSIEANIHLLENVPFLEHSLNDAIEQLDELANTFLAILKIADIESRANIQKFHPVDLNAVIADVLEMYLPIFEDLNGKIYVLYGDISIIFGDYTLIRQLLINLVNNSIQHSTQKIEVTISIETRGKEVVLFVKDRGPGIPKPDRERVFEQFVRLSSHGTGLGLSIVKAIAQMHDARVVLHDNHPGLIVEIVFLAHTW